MSTFGRCCICTSSFTIADVTSLKCGHTFHAECIKHWISNSKTCPHCRKKTIQRDLVRLFFDEADVSFTQAPESSHNADVNNLQTSIETLTRQLSEARENNNKLIVTFDEFQRKIKSLKSELKAEKARASTIDVKDARIHSLESLLQDQTQLRKDLNAARARVKASEFFAYLTKKSEHKTEDAIDQFLTNTGEIDANRFIDLIDSQNKKLTERIGVLAAEIESMKRDNYEKVEKTRKYKQLVLDQKNEIESLKARLDVAEKTRMPMRSLENDLKLPARRKKSFGFSFIDESLDRSKVLSSSKLVLDDPSDSKIFDLDMLTDNFLDTVDATNIPTNSTDDNDVPTANSVTVGSLPRKAAFPKSKSISNFNKTIDILDELEYQQREKVAMNACSKPAVKTTKLKSIKPSNTNDTKSLQGIKRFLSDQDMEKAVRSKRSSTSSFEGMLSKNNKPKCNKQHRVQQNEFADVIQID